MSDKKTEQEEYLEDQIKRIALAEHNYRLFLELGMGQYERKEYEG